MYYPEDIVEEVRSKNDIVDIVSGYVRLTKKGSTYFGLCPFHNEKTGSFPYHLQNRCFTALAAVRAEMCIPFS